MGMVVTLFLALAATTVSYACSARAARSPAWSSSGL